METIIICALVVLAFGGVAWMAFEAGLNYGERRAELYTHDLAREIIDLSLEANVKGKSPVTKHGLRRLK